MPDAPNWQTLPECLLLGILVPESESDIPGGMVDIGMTLRMAQMQEFLASQPVAEKPAKAASAKEKPAPVQAGAEKQGE